MAVASQTKAITLIFLLLVIGQVLGIPRGIDEENPENKAIERMRKLADMVTLDYTPSKHNSRHEPPSMSAVKLGGRNR